MTEKEMQSILAWSEEQLATKRFQLNTAKATLQVAKTSQEEDEKNLGIKMAQLKESEAKATCAWDQAAKVERATNQARKEVNQARMAQSRLADEIVATEHCLVNSATKDVEDFK